MPPEAHPSLRARSSQSFIHQGILSDIQKVIENGNTMANALSRNPLFIKEFFLTLRKRGRSWSWRPFRVAILYSSRNSFWQW
jgi:hypothetical protein